MKTAVLIALVMLFAVGANAQVLLLEENFNYTTGDTLGSYWNFTSGTAGQLFITASGLTYTGYESSGIGKAVQLQTSESEDLNKSFTAQTSGTVFASFLVNVSSVNTTGDYFFHFGENPFNTSNLRGRVFVKRDASNNLAFGLSKSSSVASAAFTPFSYAYNTTYLIVLKYKIVAGATNDSVSLFIFQEPTAVPTTEPGTPTLGPNVDVSSTDIVNVGAVGIRQGASGNRPTMQLDGIRVSDSWDFAPLPVELTSFTAIAKGRGVELAWKTATELNNKGFEIQRTELNHRNIGSLNQSADGSMNQWHGIGFIAGNGTTNAPKSYSFVDNSASGTVQYRLKQVDNDGSFEYSSAVEVNVAAPAAYTLSQNHPNPFNPATTISYSLPAAGFVTLKVYDMLGKEVTTLVNGMQESGANKASFDASQLPSGIYFARLSSGSFNSVIKMTLMK